MADLNKLFVYVKTGDNKTFTDNVINGSAEVQNKYANKIVFLEASGQLWVKKHLYGGDAGSLSTQIGAVNDKVTALEKKIPVVTGSGTTVTVEDATDESTGKHTYTVKSDTLDTEITNLKKADTNLGTKITNEVAAVNKKIPDIVVAGSGLSIDKTKTTEDGRPLFTITADAGIWEFMGTVPDGDTTIAANKVSETLTGKYPVSVNGVQRAVQVGDVWAVKVTGQGTVMYAWNGTAWNTIGAADGVSKVNTTPSKGVSLTNTSGVLGVNVTPGAIAANNDAVVTGGIVYTYLGNYDTSDQVDGKFTTKLEPYAKTADVDTKLKPYAKTADVDTKLEPYAKTADVDTKLEPYAKTADVDTKLNAKLDATTAADTYVKITDINENLWETYVA